jgi:D-threo-aldose 1-dehydrogenase
MTTVHLGRTGIAVARLGLGAAPLGDVMGPVSDAMAEAILHEVAREAPVLVDTAPFYGLGLSEMRVGRGLSGIPRSAVVLSTKVGRLIRDGAIVEDYSYDGALRSIDESLTRLGQTRIDIVHVHDPDDHFDAAMTGAFRALHRLRDEEAIGAVSAGMNQWQMLSRFVSEGVVDCVLLAGRYTLLEQGAAGFLDQCQAAGVGVILGGVFNSGLLADPQGNPSYNYAPAAPDLIARALTLQEIAARHGVPIATAALQFPFRHPGVTTVITGVRSVDEWNANRAALSTPCPDALWSELAAI